MQLRQVARPDHQLLTEAFCDYGIEPRPSTNEVVDFVIGQDGRIYPIITLHREGVLLEIDFEEGFDPLQLRTGSSTIRTALRGAVIEFLQEDPTNSEVFVTVICGAQRLEQEVLTQDLEPFIFFPYDGGTDELDPDEIEH